MTCTNIYVCMSDTYIHNINFILSQWQQRAANQYQQQSGASGTNQHQQQSGANQHQQESGASGSQNKYDLQGILAIVAL